MPPHPTDACYCHVIAAGVRNVQRLAAAGDLAGVVAETEHLAVVTNLLDDYLLYRGTAQFDESRHRWYWHEARAAYKVRAGPASLTELESPWYFLAFMLGHPQDPEPVTALDGGRKPAIPDS